MNMVFIHIYNTRKQGGRCCFPLNRWMTVISLWCFILLYNVSGINQRILHSLLKSRYKLFLACWSHSAPQGDEGSCLCNCSHLTLSSEKLTTLPYLCCGLRQILSIIVEGNICFSYYKVRIFVYDEKIHYSMLKGNCMEITVDVCSQTFCNFFTVDLCKVGSSCTVCLNLLLLIM